MVAGNELGRAALLVAAGHEVDVAGVDPLLSVGLGFLGDTEDGDGGDLAGHLGELVDFLLQHDSRGTLI